MNNFSGKVVIKNIPFIPNLFINGKTISKSDEKPSSKDKSQLSLELLDEIFVLIEEKNISFYVKPVDSSGGKGVSHIQNIKEEGKKQF